MSRDVGIHGGERGHDRIVRSTVSLFGVVGGPDSAQQRVSGSGRLHLLVLGLPLGDALLSLDGGLLRSLARLVHKSSHEVLQTAEGMTLPSPQCGQ
jgi:hypothetical protein